MGLAATVVGVRPRKNVITCESEFLCNLLLTAYFDSPTEIREWCSSKLCREICAYLDIDLNRYRDQMLIKAKKSTTHGAKRRGMRSKNDSCPC